MKILILILLSSSLFAFNFNPNSITVSGISSGGYMANQFHIAHSSKVKGAAILAAGPYMCSGGSPRRALLRCMSTKEGLPSLVQSLHFITQFSKSGKIDTIQNLKGDKVIVLRGKNDTVVQEAVSKLLATQYKSLGVNNVIEDFSSEVGHAFPTLDFGNECEEARKSPFISKCNRDFAKEVLQYFYGRLKLKAKQKSENMIELFQWENEDLSKFSLAKSAFAYVPTSCKIGAKCRLHISFHGCNQSVESIGDVYIKNLGFNEWAESNNIIVLYPQTIKLNDINPFGCWDWMGYNKDINFANKESVQMKMLMELIHKLKVKL